MVLFTERSKINKYKRKEQCNIRGKKYIYEDYHKEINGQLMKKCLLHYHYFPEEDEWLLCSEEYFHKNDKNKTVGLYPYCKECNKKKSIESRIRNRDGWLASCIKRNAKPEVKQIMRETAKKQRESGYQKEYQKKNKKQIGEYSKDKTQHRTHTITEKEWKSCKEYFKNEKSEYCCAYCGMTESEHKKLFGQQLHKEHVIHEGSNNLDNCICACKHCNSQKWKFTLEEWYKEGNPVFSQDRLDKIYKWLNEDYKSYIRKKSQ